MFQMLRMESPQATLSIPVKLHQGGRGMRTSLPDSGQATQGSSLQQPVSSTIDMQISQVVQKYHNPDPLLRLIDPAN